MISESGLWWFVRIATIISLNVNIRRYVCHSVKHADGCPVGVDWGTEGFYSYNDANAIGGTCVDVIFSKYNQ